MPDTPCPTRRLLFPLAVGLVSVLCFLRYLPGELSLSAVVLGDQGWPLAVDALLDGGLVPTRDYGYFYGLLAVAVDRVWFAAFGRTPEAVAGLIAAGCVLTAAGLVRFGRAARLGRWPRVLLVCTVPVAVMPLMYPTPLHAIEAGLLVNALAFQARGRLAPALTLATLAVLVKPGLGYFYGLALVLLILTERGGGPVSRRERLRALLPAASVGLVTAAGLALWLGIGPVLDTLLPTGAARTYQDEGFGFFFGVGRNFWLPVGARPVHYLLLPVGFWLVATVWLTVGAARRVGRLRDPVAATAVTCAFLHLGFVLFLFGNEWSWLYYSAVLVCGLCAVVGDPARPGGSGWTAPVSLAVLAVVGQLNQTAFAVGSLWTHGRSPTTAGLYATPADTALWGKVREIGRGGRGRVMVFGPSGGASVVFPELDSPRAWFLLRGAAIPPEVERVRAQLRAADWLVLPNTPRPFYAAWPAFAAEVAGFREVEQSPSFRLCRRDQRPGTDPGVERPPAGK